MDLENQVHKLLQQTFDASEIINFSGDGRHWDLTIISEKFLNKSRLDRRRMVYSLLNDLISQDIIHALKMQLKTPEENESTT